MNKIMMSAGAALLLLAGGLSAQAAGVDAGPVKANSQAMKADDQAAMPQMSMRQQIQDQLTKSGYTNVKVMPSSFVVQAVNKKGDPVEMMIGPDSMTSITEIPAPATTAAQATPNVTPPATPKN
ncbi:hypothetical protein [Lichenihabitans psoromatis]|uniref:hypothetical protein n=1 Tax=Lichenihabitans psoromatis TaxID=2528642 RepID=UPI0010358DA8|nr:hypothetical protein [Lichenihabitans psoromatis]